MLTHKVRHCKVEKTANVTGFRRRRGEEKERRRKRRNSSGRRKRRRRIKIHAVGNCSFSPLIMERSE
jgi:hypothetical protein